MNQFSGLDVAFLCMACRHVVSWRENDLTERNSPFLYSACGIRGDIVISVAISMQAS